MAKTLPPDLSELTKRLGVDELDELDTERAKTNLEDATVLVLAEAPERVATHWSTNAPDVVHLIVLKAARREFENPRGFSTEQLGEHSVGGMDTSGVYLTAREIATIRRVVSGRRGGWVGTVRTPSAYGDGS
ncbi:hypothetical protein [Pseudoclavibacter sp. RFBA6]|uniref:hypothetical protein n=1 Tax=Pseudoclavibacter sp. RFBA6 TaxID=2080573 RepID=UPI000CE83EC7|nr:hypothetical protein [Pseudoclavibacter sp. RFBA6]PPG39464.1 hypothetical protein C5C17_11780 [Pseudoclavibacter sp. RFBA6]